MMLATKKFSPRVGDPAMRRCIAELTNVCERVGDGALKESLGDGMERRFRSEIRVEGG